MKSSKTVLAILFSCLMVSSMLITPTQAGKKKMLAAFLIGAALASKPKILPIPLPVPIPIKSEHKKYVPYPEPVPYPVYIEKDYAGYSGGYDGY